MRKILDKVLLSVLIFCVIFFLIYISLCVIAVVHIRFYDYYSKKIGVSILHSRYDDVIKKFGEPNSVEFDNFTATIFYKDLSIKFISENGKDIEKDAFIAIVDILSNRYKFRNDICVGSSSKDVMEAYKEIKKSPDCSWAYIDGKILVKFTIKNGEVIKITLGHAEP